MVMALTDCMSTVNGLFILAFDSNTKGIETFLLS